MDTHGLSGIPVKDSEEPSSLRSRVFRALRRDILNGTYKEHEELREAAIAEELGVSRTPVREALRQLELEGLVHIVPNKGAYVTGITAKDVADIYAIRSLLEGLCARWATARITDKQLEELEENVFLSEYHEARGHAEQLTWLDNRFHEILYEASDSKLLEQVLREFHEYVHRVRRETFADKDRALHSVREHKQIMEAIRDHDADLAEQLSTEHVRNAYDSLVSHGLAEVYGTIPRPPQD